LLLSPSASAQPPQKESWIVTLAPGVDPATQAKGLSRQVAGESRYVYRHVLNGFSFRGSAKAAAALERNPNVLRVQPSGVYEMTDQDPTGVLRIGARAASELGHTGRMSDGTRVRVAVLDTGVMADHDDLRDNVVEGEGRNCFDAVPPGDPVDDQGHGTHVAGTVGAVFDGAGVVGVATEVSIAAVKVLDSQGRGTDEEVICGLDHVAALAADGIPTVINMSLGEERIEGTGCASSPLHQTICDLRDQNLLVVTAMGNNGVDGSNFYPAAFPETVGVSAFADLNGAGGSSSGCQLFLDTLFQCDESLANFTNWGSAVDVAAPGVNIMSTTKNGGWGNNSGTSMASPHVAGVAALVLAADPSLTPDEVRTILQETGECPDGSTSGAATCDGHGQWQMSQLLGGTAPDPDGIPEPLVDARAAADAAAAGADDVVPPVITLNPPNPQLVTIGNAYPEFGAGAVDDRDGDLSPAIVIDASVVNTSTVGTYPVTYDVSDSSGNATQVVRSVEVVSTPDLSPPVLTLNGPAPQVIAQGDPYVELGATAIDSFDGDLSTAVAVDASAVDTSTPGSYPVTYDVADSSGNAATQLVRTVDVVADDRTAPIITLLGEDTQTVVQGFRYVESGATAFDDIDGDVSASIVIDTSVVDTSTPGSFQVTYEASDAAGNVALATRTVDVVTATAQTSYLLDFAAMDITPFGTQDVSSSMAVEDDGASLRVTGNGWKKVHLPTVITPNTMLEFDFSSSVRGEVHGVGFDTDESLSSNWTFKVYGTQNWGITHFANYPGSGVTHYTIPVGLYFTGTFDYLFFATDHDVSSPTAESLISNVEVYESQPLTSYTVDFAEMPVVSYDNQDVDSVMSVEDGGASLRVTGNGWKMTPIPTEITADSVLEFDFSSSVRGEVHGVGFDTNESPSSNQTFKVYGTQNWGITDFANYPGSGVTHYTIPVGQYFTGTFNYLVFVTDHDVSSPTAESWFSDVELHAEPPADVTPPEITLVGDDPQTVVQPDVYEELGATAVDDVDGDVSGAIVIDASAVDTSTVGSYQVSYAVSDAAGNLAEVSRQVEVVPGGPASPDPLDFSALEITPFGTNDVSPVMTVEDGGASLRLTGNAWKKVLLPTVITPDTVLEFDFSSSAKGEVHGIGFDTDESLSSNRTFKVYGTQNWGLSQYASYVAPGTMHYTIPVGQHFTGTFDYMVFANDHDVPSPTAESWFSNVKVYEAAPATSYAVDFAAMQVGSYGANDVDSVMTVEDGGVSLRVTGNGWKMIMLPTEITPNSMLEFDFSSSAQGEVHGIGFDTDLAISSTRTFRLYGSQRWGLRQYATYVGPGTMHFTIPVGQYFTGRFAYLVLANDHDVASPTAESWFSDVRLYKAAP
jgi:subtilisin family serine protease